MEHQADAGIVAEMGGVLKRLGRLIRGRIAEFSREKREEIATTLRQARQEVEEEIQSTDKK